MSVRKFREYWIRVEYPNGNYDTIEYIDERKVDKSNYQEMLNVYRDTKEQYEGTPCTILFMGNNREEFVEMFSKTFKTKIKSFEDKENETLEDLNTINLLRNNINERFANAKDLEGLATKRVSEFYHKVLSNIGNLNNEDKIKRYEELEILLLNRSECIDNNKVVNRYKSLFENMAKDDEKLNSIIQTKIQHHARCSNEIINQEGRSYEGNSIKKYSYKNFKDKINLTKQLLPKYDKVIDDEENMELCCYIKLYNK